MTEGDVLQRPARRLHAHELPKPIVRKRALDCAQPIGALGMAGGREVLEASGVGDEKRGHRAIRERYRRSSFACNAHPGRRRCPVGYEEGWCERLGGAISPRTSRRLGTGVSDLIGEAANLGVFGRFEPADLALQCADAGHLPDACRNPKKQGVARPPGTFDRIG